MPRIVLVRRGPVWLAAGALALSITGLSIWGSWPSSFASTPKHVYEVIVDGQTVAHVRDPRHIEEAVQALIERESLSRGHLIEVSSRIASRRVDFDPQQPVNTVRSDALTHVLADAARLQGQAVAIVVDGEPVVAVRGEAEARAAVDRVIEHYKQRLAGGDMAPPGGGRIDEQVTVDEIEVVEHITYESIDVDPDKLHDAESAASVLINGTDQVKEYTIADGESLWTIARANHMSVDDLQRANPQLSNPNRLRVGDKLNLVSPEPFITLRSKETRSYERLLNFPTVVERDDSLYPWERYVKQAGVHGRQRVVERVERVDGKIVNIEIVSDTVLSEPRPQIMIQGGKSVPEMGSGLFRWPVDGGKLTDRFGYSSWRRRHHNGIDIAAPHGTPIYAVDNGVVTYAATKSGGMGKTVIIDHGGSVVTLYGHMASISVSVGQKVSLGDKIGAVGRTGFATGPNVHFEVHVNGRSVDPLRFYQGGGS